VLLNAPERSVEVQGQRGATSRETEQEGGGEGAGEEHGRALDPSRLLDRDRVRLVSRARRRKPFMPLVNHAHQEIHLKVVYYGPELGGKTTNLEHIHART